MSDKLRNVHRQFCTSRRLWCDKCKASDCMPPTHQNQWATVDHRQPPTQLVMGTEWQGCLRTPPTAMTQPLPPLPPPSALPLSNININTFIWLFSQLHALIFPCITGGAFGRPCLVIQPLSIVLHQLHWLSAWQCVSLTSPRHRWPPKKTVLSRHSYAPYQSDVDQFRQQSL